MMLAYSVVMGIVYSIMDSNAVPSRLSLSSVLAASLGAAYALRQTAQADDEFELSQ